MITATYEPLPHIVADKYYLLGTRLLSFREPFKECIRAVLIPRISDNFTSGGNPAWASLAADTVTDRAVYGYGPEPKLVRTGLLKRTASQQNIWNIDFDKAWIDAASFSKAQGGNAWYGLAQNDGFVGGYGSVTPARPFLSFTQTDIDEMAAIFSIWMYEAELTSGFKVGSAP